LRLTVGGEYLTAKLKDCPAVEGLNKWRYARVSPTQRDDLERQLDALREWVRKTLGEVGVIEEGYRFRIERG
jgi:predicted site-specific integrase-resolvase